METSSKRHLYLLVNASTPLVIIISKGLPSSRDSTETDSESVILKWKSTHNKYIKKKPRFCPGKV